VIDRFSWRTYDLRSLLPENWRTSFLRLAKGATAKTLLPHSVTSREGDPNLRIPVLTVNGIVLRDLLPWLYRLYRGLFKDLAQLGTPELVFCAEKDLYGAVLNVQCGTAMRYECHVD